MKEITAVNYDETVKSGFVVMDVWADWCGPCKKFAPIFEKVAIAMSDKATFVKMDAEDNHVIASKLNISSLPSILILKNGNVITTHSGLISEKDLIKKIEGAMRV